MPNFWSKAEQFIGESLNGPRTKDKEYEKITEKMKAVELGLINLKQILQKLQVASNQMELVFKELNMVCYQIYQDSPYLNAIEGIQLKNKNIEKEFSNFSKIISNIFSKTSELTKVFNIPKEQIKIREEKRKIYDHYEKKLEKICNKNINKKEKEYLERNKEKYQKAVVDYVDISEKVFNSINLSFNRTYDIVNPILSELENNEKNIFNKLNNYCNFNKDIDLKFEECKILANNPNNISNFYSYDPTKYMDKGILKRGSLPINSGNFFGKVSHSLNNNINEVNNNVVLINLRLRSSFVDFNENEFKKFNDIKDDIGFDFN